MPISKLLSVLADGQPHHITKLAQVLERQPHQLNPLWQKVVPHIRGLLRQQDGYWCLSQPLAWFAHDCRIDGFDALVLGEATSSNDELLNVVRRGLPIHKKMVVVHHQTKGRGRQGKAWVNRSGECLMFSFGWSFGQTQQELGALALVVALACQRALARFFCPVQLKWPNDLVVGTDKLGGILIETVRHHQQTHAVVGIGINFVLPKAQEGLGGVSSVLALSAQEVGAVALLNELAGQLSDALTVFEQQGFAPFLADYRQVHRDHLAQVCVFHQQNMALQGKVLDVLSNGALCLQDDDGVMHTVFSGEISLRRPEQLAVSDGVGVAPEQHALLLDCGNSRVKWAWVQGGKLVRLNRASYRNLSALSDEWGQLAQEHTRLVGVAVCGLFKQSLVAQQMDKPIEWLTSERETLGIINHYRNLQAHGADRWFNALGSRRFTQNACVIVSCGTAVTVDALSADNHYLGGTILPGFHLMRESLFTTGKISNQPEGRAYPFPTSTANAITSGMVDAVCGSIMIMHGRLKERYPDQVVDVLITGGGASKVVRAMPSSFTLDNDVKIVDNLVIFGLLNWIEQA